MSEEAKIEQGNNLLSAAKRGAMIDIAIELIAEGGLGALTFRSLAAAAGTSTAPFTTEFGSREVMLEEILKVVWRRLGFREGETDPEDALETLRRVLRRATPVEQPVSPEMTTWLELYMAATHNEELKKALVEVEAEEYPTYIGLIEQAQAGGQIPGSLDPNDLLAALWALGDGILLGYMIYPDHFTAERADRVWEQGFEALTAEPS